MDNDSSLNDNGIIIRKKMAMTTYEYIVNKNVNNQFKTAVCIRLKDGGVRSYTYVQLFTCVDMFAEALERAAIKPGDRVAIAAENCPEWCAAYLAASKLKATAVLLDASLSGPEIKIQLEKSKVRCIFGTPKVIEKLGSFPNVSALNILDGAKPFEGWDCNICAETTVAGNENISTILFSSGTTKTASGIMHSHEGLLGTTNMVIENFPLHSEHRFLAVLPNSHIYGLICQVLGALMLGASLCYLEDLSSDSLVGAFREFQPTILPSVPKMYELLKTQIMHKIDGNPKTGKLFKVFFPKCLALRKKTGINLGKVLFKDIHKGFGSKIEILCSAGSPISPETAEFYYGTGFCIAITYGATETNIPTIGNYGGKFTTDTSGRAYPDVSVKISDTGEILVKSPYMMLGYFNDEAATRAAFDSDGWFSTGDLGSFDAKTGNIKILGRCKDNIVLATGKKIAPDDIEDAYANIEGVKELVICGIPVSDGGYDEVHAFVVAESAKAGSVQERLKTRSAKLSHTMKLAGIHLVDAIPKTSLLKPKRYLLRQMVEQHKSEVISAAPQDVNADIDIASIVRIAVAKIAKVNVSEVLPETKLFSELAIDSLGSIELCCELEETWGLNADITCFLHKEMTVAELTEYIIVPDEGKKQTLSRSYPMLKNLIDYNIFRFTQNVLQWIYSIKIENDRTLPENGGYIICSNHVSNFDYLFLTPNFKWERFSRFCCMAKKELNGEKPLSRMVAKIAGMVPVDRSGFANDAFSAVSGKLRENWGVLIHPEGTRSEDGRVSRFKKGAALLSIETNVPIIPAYIDGGYEIYPKSKKLPNFFNWKEMKKYKVKVKYGEPISPVGLSADELINIVESAVIQLKNGKEFIYAQV